MISLILTGVGLIFIWGSKGIAQLIYDTQVKYFGSIIGDSLKSKQSGILKVYRIGVIVGGVFALLGAYGVAFGPIYL